MSQAGRDWDPVEDTDNLNQKMQIRAINEARKKVRQVRNRAQEQIASATPAERPRANRGGQRVYLEVVKAYALELAPLVAQHSHDLWNDTTLVKATWEHQPPNSNKEIKEIEPKRAGVEISGLAQLLGTEFPLESRFEVTYRDSAKGDDVHIHTSEWVPSFTQTDTILIELDSARSGLGIFLEGPDEIGVESDEPV